MRMPFAVVSGVGQGMGVLDRVVIVERPDALPAAEPTASIH